MLLASARARPVIHAPSRYCRSGSSRLLLDLVGSAGVADRDAPRLHRVRHFANEIDDQETMLERGLLDLHRLASGTAVRGRNRIRKRQKSFKWGSRIFGWAQRITEGLIGSEAVQCSPGRRCSDVPIRTNATDRRFAVLAQTESLLGARSLADRQQHEKAPITLVPGGRTGAFASAHDHPAILVLHAPFPTPAALGHDHVVHARRDIRRCYLFQSQLGCSGSRCQVGKSRDRLKLFSRGRNILGYRRQRHALNASERIPRTAAPPSGTRRGGTAPRGPRHGRAAPSARNRIRPAGRCAASAGRSRRRGR
ncbi:hypothetical protein V1292_001818 [Bradyrhizobium sp. AZCC 1719]